MVVRLLVLVAVVNIVHGGYYGPSQSQGFFGGGNSQGFTFPSPGINFANVIAPRQPPARLPAQGFG